MSRVVIFGDSITWGASDHEKGGWVSRLNLEYLNKFDDCQVYNLGISGDTSKNVLDRFSSEIAARTPEVIIVAIGINDACLFKGVPQVSLSDFLINIKKIIEFARSVDAELGIIGLTRVYEEKTNPVDYDDDYSWENDIIDTYDQKLRELCGKESISYCDVSKVLNDSNLPDGVHPNDVGHEKLFKIIEEFITNNFL